MRVQRQHLATAVLFLLTAQSCIVLCQDEKIIDETNCYDAMGRATRCVSPRRSFSFEQQPQVNSTCGSLPTQFCSREVNVLLGTISSNCDQVCDASDPRNAHPPELMTDFILNEDSWWQSENSLVTQNRVVIDLALDTLVELSVITFDFVSIIPSAFRILRSDDFGQTFTPFHFFASSCIDTYGINPDQVLSLDTETSVLCQQTPAISTSGQITFFPAQYRPSSNDSVPGYSEGLYNFITATDIRVVLDEHSPIANLPPDDLGYYYAIEDLNVVGSCQCYGHASSCVLDPTSGDFACSCQHNTTGTNCERCADFYQDVPWSRADGNGFIKCRACTCNNHSTSCVFDEQVYEETGQTSGGVCLDCEHNTSGRQCERCAERFYPQTGLPITHPDICAACDCVLAGVTDNGMCAQEAGSNGLQPGDCNCKENTQGRTCGQCVSGFYNLSGDNPLGCQECQCNVTGSVDSNCNQVSGVCSCKPNIIGDNCDECRVGFYLLEPNSPQGCQPCNCNLGGSLSEQCDTYTGQCPCQVGVEGRTCSETTPGYFFPEIDFMILEAENVLGASERDILTGSYRITDGSSDVNLGTLTPPVSGRYEIVFRYSLEGAMTWESATLRVEAGSSSNTMPTDCGNLNELGGTTELSYVSWIMGVDLPISQTACLRGGRPYTFELRDFTSGQSGGSATLDIDSLVLILVDAPGLRVFSDVQLSLDYTDCVDSWRSLITKPFASLSCEQTTFAVSVAAYNGTLECDCDPIGTRLGGICEAFGGQCPCLPGVRGRQCDDCNPGFFNLTTTGCSMCACDQGMSMSAICDMDDGSCECLDNTIGRDCSSCAADHWPGPVPGMGCIPCTCNATGSITTQCDMQTGVCECKDGVQGDVCDQCLTRHYGFTEAGCSPCNCSESGSTNFDCDIDDGQCSCKALAFGRDCSECVSGTFNLQLSNPDGCQPCFCSGQSNSCSFAEGFVSSTVASDFSSSDLQGWTVVNGTLYALSPLSVLLFSSEGITVRANSEVFLQSPDEFLGNKLSSYGQFIELSYETLNATLVQTISTYDVIISGNGIELGTSFPTNITGPGSITIQVQLHEAAGWTDTTTDIPASAYDMQFVLSSLDLLLVTSGYDADVIFRSISIDTAVPSSSMTQNGNYVTWVEQCTCPTNYTGLSCEECAPGYTRTLRGTCELCECNGFSETCDPNTGECLNCSQSTTGRSCELCIEGTFGNPTDNIDCQPCPCPLTSGVGQFTNQCVLVSGRVMCLDCPQGHTGIQCETCLSGFFGDPTGNVTGTPTGCSDCLCNGNIDPNVAESCDPVTGVCTRCLNNTAGTQCERCADGFYGDAVIAKNCTVCECSADGSTGECDPYTGQCECHPNVVGRQCNQCEAGHYGLASGSGCQPCSCQVGAVDVNCNEAGQCTCQPGVTGMTCDQCMPGFFGLTSNGCEECSCSQTNSETDTCDVNGQCICRAGSTGNECQQCIFNYYQTSQGCTQCPRCYQELAGELSVTHGLLSSNIEEVQNFTNLTSSSDFTPFDSRLSLEQQNVGNILAQAQDLGRINDELTSQYEDLFELINQTLVSQIAQTNISLDELQGASTTVFVLAYTSTELVNITIGDIVQARLILDRIETEILPSVESSASRIQNNLENGTQTVQQLLNNVVLLSQQLELLNNITYTIVFLSTMAQQDIQQTQMVLNGTATTLYDIQEIRALVEAAIPPLTARVQTLIVQIMMTASSIQQTFDSLVSVPSVDQLNALISNATAAESYATSIVNEIAISQAEFLRLNETLTYNQQELQDLQAQLASLEQAVSNFVLQAENAYTIATDAERFANTIIREGELILENLRNFNNNSLQVAVKAAEALQAVSMITSSAAMALDTAEGIEERVGALSETVSTARDIALNTLNTTANIDEDLGESDTERLLRSATESLDSSINSRETVRNLSIPVTNILANFENQRTRINNVESSLEVARNQTNQTDSLRTQANNAVEQLEDMLESLQTTDEASIVSVEELIVSVERDINEADIPGMYSTLQSKLQEQRSRREQLEADLESIEPILAHLVHINSTLPLDCDG